MAVNTTTYKNVKVQSPTPTGAAGKRIDDNFKALADRCYGITSNSTQSSNQTGGTYSVVVGGWSNGADGSYSVVVGGENNFAFGNYSFVGGSRCARNHQRGGLFTNYDPSFQQVGGGTIVKSVTCGSGTEHLLYLPTGAMAVVQFHILYPPGPKICAGKLLITASSSGTLTPVDTSGDSLDSGCSFSRNDGYLDIFPGMWTRCQVGIVATIIGADVDDSYYSY